MLRNSVSLSKLNIVVVGLAREGSAVAHFLAQQGAQVTVTDVKSAAQLADQVSDLQDIGITFQLGGHPETLLGPKQNDLLAVSPGVPLTIPFLQQARAKGLPLTTESRLFCQLCPAPIIGISGSSGKTTTTTLVGKMLEAEGHIAHVGGNIGQPLIKRLGQTCPEYFGLACAERSRSTQHRRSRRVQPSDWVVMELSSFQLEYFHASLNQNADVPPHLQALFQDWSPKIGALLNITPNHLDRHKTMAAYTQAKRAVVDYLGSGQTAILGWDNPATRKIGNGLSAPVRWFSLNERVETGACLSGGHITLVNRGAETPICPASDIKLRGEYNLYNVLAACAIADAAGVSPEAMAAVATTFAGVPHRLELVVQRQGVAYYNDSTATSPERLMAALKAFDEPIILLAGGKDKDLPWDEAARLMAQRVKHLILFGQARELILEAVKRVVGQDVILSVVADYGQDVILSVVADYGQDNILSYTTAGENTFQIHLCRTLEEAVARAEAIAQPGDVVLLSPGGTSFDAYPDFAVRGEHFRELARSA